MDRIAEYQPSVSLDFVDADHVLLTFNRKQLIKRMPECTPDHQDRLMHAAILEVPSGKVVTETDWFLHDRRRYLWSLSPGKILLRRWNNLYVVDSSLHETLLLKSPKDLLWVSVTPGGGQIIVETENEKKAADSAPRSSSKSEPKYVVQFLDVKTTVSNAVFPARCPAAGNSSIRNCQRKFCAIGQHKPSRGHRAECLLVSRWSAPCAPPRTGAGAIRSAAGLAGGPNQLRFTSIGNVGPLQRGRKC
jgi:hypothetical protein